MGFQKDSSKKEFVCREYTIFLDQEDLENGCCPECHSDESVFVNDINEEYPCSD